MPSASAFDGAFIGQAFTGLHSHARCSGRATLEIPSHCPGSAALLGAVKGLRAVFVGHDHDNAWCCEHEVRFGLSAASLLYTDRPQDMLLCYGQHTGYGGYDAGSGRGGTGRARDQRHRRDVRQNGCLSATGITCTM